MTATPNSFVGLFGRQTALAGLDVPQGVTIYIDRGDADSKTLNGLLTELIEGVAIVGAAGVTLVQNLPATEWARSAFDPTECAHWKRIMGCRPYFRLISCNPAAVEENGGEGLVAGRLVVVTNGRAAGELPAPLRGEEAVCIDYLTTMVAKTNRPSELVRDALEQIAELDVRKLPHWSDPLSASLLNSTTVLLAMNALCKPDRLKSAFLFASDYLDEMVARAFNDRGLRARRRKAAPEAAPAPAPEETENAE